VGAVTKQLIDDYQAATHAHVKTASA